MIQPHTLQKEKHMDYSQILVTLTQSIKEYRKSVLQMQYDASAQYAETVRKLADDLIKSTESLRGEYGDRNK